MDREIVLARERDGYRIVSGHHHLDADLSARKEAFVDIVGESGRGRVFAGECGWLVCKDSRHLPLLDKPFRRASQPL
jgi:hypothetical protein